MLKKLIGLTLAVLLLLGMTAGAAWAYFRDTETSTGNSFTLGTLDLVPLVTGSYTGGPAGLYQVTAGGNGINGNVVFDTMAPDQYGTIKWVLSNTGSIAGTLTVALSGLFSDGLTAKVPESLYDGASGRLLNNASGHGELDQYVMVALQKGVGSSQVAAEAAMTYMLGPTPVALSNMAGVLNGNTTSMTASGGSASYVVYLFSWYLTSATLGPLYNSINITQGDTAQLDLTFTLNQ
jgi:predicted ribosomally synthesized peptide with SipW-like signal peptide